MQLLSKVRLTGLLSLVGLLFVSGYFFLRASCVVASPSGRFHEPPEFHPIASERPGG